MSESLACGSQVLKAGRERGLHSQLGGVNATGAGSWKRPGFRERSPGAIWLKPEEDWQGRKKMIRKCCAQSASRPRPPTSGRPLGAHLVRGEEGSLALGYVIS